MSTVKSDCAAFAIEVRTWVMAALSPMSRSSDVVIRFLRRLLQPLERLPLELLGDLFLERLDRFGIQLADADPEYGQDQQRAGIRAKLDPSLRSELRQWSSDLHCLRSGLWMIAHAQESRTLIAFM